VPFYSIKNKYYRLSRIAHIYPIVWHDAWSIGPGRMPFTALLSALNGTEKVPHRRGGKAAGVAASCLSFSVRSLFVAGDGLDTLAQGTNFELGR